MHMPTRCRRSCSALPRLTTRNPTQAPRRCSLRRCARHGARARTCAGALPKLLAPPPNPLHPNPRPPSLPRLRPHPPHLPRPPRPPHRSSTRSPSPSTLRCCSALSASARAMASRASTCSWATLRDLLACRRVAWLGCPCSDHGFMRFCFLVIPLTQTWRSCNNFGVPQLLSQTCSDSRAAASPRGRCLASSPGQLLAS